MQATIVATILHLQLPYICIVTVPSIGWVWLLVRAGIHVSVAVCVNDTD